MIRLAREYVYIIEIDTQFKDTTTKFQDPKVRLTGPSAERIFTKLWHAAMYVAGLGPWPTQPIAMSGIDLS